MTIPDLTLEQTIIVAALALYLIPAFALAVMTGLFR